MGSKLSPDKKEEIWLEFQKDPCYERVAKKCGVNWKTVRNVVRRVEARKSSNPPDSKDKSIEHNVNPISSENCGTKSNESIVPNMTTPRSDYSPEGELQAQYLDQRRQGKTCLDCVIELKLTREKADKLESDYTHFKNQDQCYNVAKRLLDEGIDCELLIKEVEENGSIRLWREKLAEMKTIIRDESVKLTEIQSQSQTLRLEYPNLVRANVNLKTSNNSLAEKKKKLEADNADATRRLEQIHIQINQARADFSRECIEMKSRMTQAARKLIEEFTKNDNRKLEALFVSLIWALRQNPTVHLEIWSNSGPITPAQASALYQKYGRELAISNYYCETVLHQAVNNAAAEGYTNPNMCDKPEPQQIFVHQNAAVQMPPVMKTSETLLTPMPQPLASLQPTPVDKFSSEQTWMDKLQDPEFLAELTAPDEIQPATFEYSHSSEHAQDSGTCNNGQCKVTRMSQKS